MSESKYKLVKKTGERPSTCVRLPEFGVSFGSGKFSVIAGPCSVESKEQLLPTAKAVKAAGAGALRGGIFKSRSSPYSFQGLGIEGLELLKLARAKTGLPIVTELTDISHLRAFEEDVDVIQIGAKNMQNFPLLGAVGGLEKPVLLKRGIASTIEEFLMAAECLCLAGAKDIILCERGIRTFENATRNTLDLSAIPVLKQKTHLPVIVDPSHGTGDHRLVEAMTLAATAAGADGLMIEVHPEPAAALCDGDQALTPKEFNQLMEKITKIRQVI